MGLPADPVGRALAQSLLRDQYERWLYGEITRLLEAGFKDVIAKMLGDYSSLTAGQRARVARLFADINGHLADAYGSAGKLMQSQMDGLSKLEVQVARAHAEALLAKSTAADVTLGSLTAPEIKAIARLPIAGLDIGEWFEKQATDMSIATRRNIQMGLMQGETIPDLAKRIMPGRTTVTPSVYKQARHATTALVRTTVTAVSNMAAVEGYAEAGADVTDRYRYVAVRDARTTPLCRALDGRIFRYDDPKRKMPPQHVNCRSTVSPVVNYKKIGLPEPKAGAITYGSYDTWLRAQPDGVQNTILGSARAALYRAGKIGLPELVSTDGRALNLKQLKAAYS